MLSDQYILSLIEKYSKTNSGVCEISKRKSGKFNAKFAKESQGKTPSRDEMAQIGNDMKNILFRKISKVIPSFKIDDIIVDAPILKNGQGSVSIRFNEDALRRESLDPDRYPEGISNIVKLFINGYDARGAVYGIWKGHGGEEIWSLRHRDPSDFMERAVSEFNKKYKKIARANTADEYKNSI